MMINLVGCSINYFSTMHGWIVAYLEWLINWNLMLKLESKDSLLYAFWLKQPSAKSLACL
jgi:hypothetical protein